MKIEAPNLQAQREGRGFSSAYYDTTNTSFVPDNSSKLLNRLQILGAAKKDITHQTINSMQFWNAY